MEANDTAPTNRWLAPRSEIEVARELTGWRRNAAAVAEAFFTTDGTPPPAERVQWTALRLSDFCATVGGKAVFAFRLALFAVTWLAPVMSGKLPTLRRHDLQTRLQIIDRFERSPFGMAIFAVKAFLCMHYFEHPDVAEEIRFDGGEHDR